MRTVRRYAIRCTYVAVWVTFFPFAAIKGVLDLCQDGVLSILDGLREAIANDE